MNKIIKWLETILIKTIIKSLNETIQDLDRIDVKVRKLGLENEQWFLDWQDELNKISVR